jgi:hypothetical protein
LVLAAAYRATAAALRDIKRAAGGGTKMGVPAISASQAKALIGF